jgi:hypothetical protein
VLYICYDTTTLITGIVWPTAKNCASTCDVYNAGASGECFASTKFKDLGFMGELKVESVGYKGDGTYCSHWSEQQLGDELMTGKSITHFSKRLL